MKTRIENNVIYTVEARYESTVVALARVCEDGMTIHMDLADALSEDGIEELTERLARKGLRAFGESHGLDIVATRVNKLRDA